MTVVDSSPSTSPAAIDAVPLRHPWRWVAAVVIVTLVVLFLYGMATNPAYRWNIFAEYLFNDRILFGVWNTLQLTIYSMVLAIVLGVVLAVMRLSPNPVFRSVSWVFLWIFRGTPIYVQLAFWGLIPTIYANIQLGVPFGPSFFHLNANQQRELHGMRRRDAIVAAAKVRLRPILMTTAAMALGVVPLIVAQGAGAAARYSMGLVIFSGILVGTTFTLFVVPMFYTLIASKDLPQHAEKPDPRLMPALGD